MNWWVVVGLAGAVLLGYLAQRFGWIDLSNKTRGGSASGMLGVVDEVFAPSRHEAILEQERQSVVPAPAPVAGDGDKGVYDGRVTIRLDDRNPGDDRDRIR